MAIARIAGSAYRAGILVVPVDYEESNELNGRNDFRWEASTTAVRLARACGWCNTT